MDLVSDPANHLSVRLRVAPASPQFWRALTVRAMGRALTLEGRGPPGWGPLRGRTRLPAQGPPTACRPPARRSQRGLSKRSRRGLTRAGSPALLGVVNSPASGRVGTDPGPAAPVPSMGGKEACFL